MVGVLEFDEYEPFATAADWTTFARRAPFAEGSRDKASVEHYLASASKLVREACEWQVWPQVVDDVLTLDGHGAREQILPVRRLSAVKSVVEHGVTLVEDVDYEWSRDGILTRLNGVWTARRRKLVATCTHGYVNSPTDLRDMVCAMAGRAFASPLGELSAAAGAMSTTYSRAMGGGEMTAGGIRLLGGERDALAHYRVR